MAAKIRPDTPKIILVADMRSPHALGWVRGMLDMGYKPLVISSRRLEDEQRRSLPADVRGTVRYEAHDFVSRARLSLTHSPALHTVRRLSRGNPLDAATDIEVSDKVGAAPKPGGTGRLELPLEMAVARHLGRAIGRIAESFEPMLIHALRIPFEGIAASEPARRWPLAISTWGQDLVTQAPSNPRLAAATHQVLARTVAIHADCRRDIHLARQWGLPGDVPALVAAGNMGFDEAVFHPGSVDHADRDLIVYPRGPSTFVNYLGYLRAAIALAAQFPNVHFVGIGLKGDPSSEALRSGATDPHRIILTGILTSGAMADLYRRSVAVVSPSISDGTPNSVLEAMACGALPIVGDIPSLAELLAGVSPRSLIDPRSTGAIKEAIACVLDLDRVQWGRSSAIVRRLALSDWSRESSRQRVLCWYESILGAGSVRKLT